MHILYLKQHNVTQKLYVGWTQSEDPSKYKGSGVHWMRHIAKHGNDVSTKILGQFEDLSDFKIAAKKYSEDFDVANNPAYANLKEEDGIGGHFGEATKKKMSVSAKERCERIGAPVGAWTSESASEMSMKTWKDPAVREARSANISAALKGGKRAPRTQEFKDLMKEKLSGRSYGKGIAHNLKKVECPHCAKEGSGPNMTRYHFDNCKQSQGGHVLLQGG